MNTEEFFLNSDSEQLEKIHGWARAQMASPWASLFGVLLRVAASTPPWVQLPAAVSDRASLNLLCAFVGESGDGKGASDAVARLAWPGGVLELPLGSGEGIAEQFVQRDGGKPPVPVIFTASEIDKLAGIAGRSGSILLSELKAAAMGEPIGQANAKKDTTRIVEAHSYRMCLSLGVQPGHAGVILGGASGGLPQRFLWAPTTDLDAPDLDSDPPAPLDMVLPTWGDGGRVVEVVYGLPEIRSTIRAIRRARLRGEGHRLDGHAMLTRCKVAALLAIMHGSLEVTKREWDWSATVMAVSNDTRAGLERDEAEINRRRFEERGKARAIEKDGFDAGRLDSVIRSILELLRRNGEMSGNELRSGVTSDNRKWFDQAIAELAEDGRIVAIKAGSGFRYRLADPRQGGDSRQGALGQFSGSGDARQGGGGVAPVSSETPSSQKNEPKKLSCQKWYDAWMDNRLAEGHGTVDRFAVLEAGLAAGYNQNQLDVAASTRRKREARLAAAS
ncbi:hypothetical protein MycrhDRAFT_6667 [Mycolicibacterium rhodesiae JS60]|nr:hypothetical protein MycrhDRAFT_6667 [Mycolicibacterium rhodesiae JS60]